MVLEGIPVPPGAYVLTPARDLFDTVFHIPNEVSATALDFFADGHFTRAYEIPGPTIPPVSRI